MLPLLLLGNSGCIYYLIPDAALFVKASLEKKERVLFPPPYPFMKLSLIQALSITSSHSVESVTPFVTIWVDKFARLNHNRPTQEQVLQGFISRGAWDQFRVFAQHIGPRLEFLRLIPTDYVKLISVLTGVRVTHFDVHHVLRNSTGFSNRFEALQRVRAVTGRRWFDEYISE
jgi:hypothetical protein